MKEYQEDLRQAVRSSYSVLGTNFVLEIILAIPVILVRGQDIISSTRSTSTKYYLLALFLDSCSVQIINPIKSLFIRYAGSKKFLIQYLVHQLCLGDYSCFPCSYQSGGRYNFQYKGNLYRVLIYMQFILRVLQSSSPLLVFSSYLIIKTVWEPYGTQITTQRKPPEVLKASF